MRRRPGAKRVLLRFLSVVVLAPLAACGSVAVDDQPADGDVSPEVDGRVEVGPDGEPDVEPDAPPDIVPDAEPDVPAEAEPDVPVLDGGPEGILDGGPAESGCPPGRVLCGDACTDTDSDPSNCGRCGNVCSAANGTATCVESECAIASCNPSWEDCDDLYSTGCEANIRTDPDNCGYCGAACDTSTGECAEGVCLEGQICIHVGEMSEPTACSGPGRAWVVICTSPCPVPIDPLGCRWFSLCDYDPGMGGDSAFCGGCLTGFAPGTYWVGGFIDRDGDATPPEPGPDPGDIFSTACVTNTVSAGSAAVSNVETLACVPDEVKK